MSENTSLQNLAAEIMVKVSTDPRWMTRAIVVLYERQTADEQAERTTSHRNGMGFNGRDAEILSSFAERILGGRSLTEKQITCAARMLPKYAGQLARVAAEKQAVQ